MRGRVGGGGGSEAEWFPRERPVRIALSVLRRLIPGAGYT